MGEEQGVAPCVLLGRRIRCLWVGVGVGVDVWVGVGVVEWRKRVLLPVVVLASGVCGYIM